MKRSGGKWLALNKTALHLRQFKCFTQDMTHPHTGQSTVILYKQKILFRRSHIYCCSVSFCRQNGVISIGIHITGNFTWEQKILDFPRQTLHRVQSVRQIHHTDQTFFESYFFLTSASYIAALLTIDNRFYLPANLRYRDCNFTQNDKLKLDCTSLIWCWLC